MKYLKIPVGEFKAREKCYICRGTCMDVCPKCSGNKVWNGKTCDECGGRGLVKCYACGGTGLVDK